MESLYFLVPCALIFIAIAVKVLFWAINNGQYDNLDTEAHRILFDDEKKKIYYEANKDKINEKLTEKKEESFMIAKWSNCVKLLNSSFG